MHRRSWVAVLMLLTLPGCARTADPGGPATTDPLDPSLVSASYGGRFQTIGTVLETPEHGPQLCYSVADSYPPQCGGPDVVDWDWSAVEAESASGTTWGTYRITGTWDAMTFALTEPAVAESGTSYPEPERLGIPCPEPAGGWQPVDAERSGQADLDAADQRASNSSGFAGDRVDQLGSYDNDPADLVYIVHTTGDARALEADLRAVWGGSLCVVGGVRFTEAEQLSMSEALREEPGALWGGSPDGIGERVDLTVYVATVQRQASLDERYGIGIVRQIALFEPLD